MYLFNANHNFFDDANKDDDALRVTDNSISPVRLTQEAQQSFLMSYATDFFDFYHYGNQTGNIGLDSSQIAPNQIYDYAVLTSLVTPNALGIINPNSDPTSEKFNMLDGTIDMYNASLSYVTESYMAPYDGAYGFQHPGLPISLGLFKLSWTVDSGLFSTAIPTAYQDISGYASISMWLAVDVANQLNTGNTAQSLMVTLQDSQGCLEHLILDNSSIALRLPDGQLSSSTYQSQWSTFTPLSNIRIPLDTFTKVDLSQITDITIRFNQTESGSIYLGDLRLLY